MAEKKVSLASMLDALKKDGARVGILDEFDRKPDAYTTGNIGLDYRIGCGGYPKGRIVEQYGPKSSGKTTSALQALAKEQAKCIATGEGYVMFLDYEKSLDEKYVRALGIDTAHPTFIYVMPDTFEEGANLYRKFLATGELRIAVFDSVASMITESETEKATGSRNVADRALMLHQFCRQITPVLERTQSTAIFLNHMMIKVDTSPMGQRLAAQGIKQKTKPGGEALNFYSSVIIEFQQIKHLSATVFDPLTNEKTKMKTQTDTRATIVKNKVGTPQGSVDLRIRYGKGFSQAYSVLQVLIGYKQVKKKNAQTYIFSEELRHPDDNKVEFTGGESAVLTAMEESPYWLEILENKAREILDAAGDLSDAALNAGNDVEEDDEVASIGGYVEGLDD